MSNIYYFGSLVPQLPYPLLTNVLSRAFSSS